MRVAVLALLVAVTGCIQSDVATCADGTICPAGTRCAEQDGQSLCVLPDQLTACATLADGDACPIGGELVGICAEDLCVRAGCGDGFIQDAEDCDGDAPEPCTAHGYYAGGDVVCVPGACIWDYGACSGRCNDEEINGDEDCDQLDLGGKDCTDYGFYRPEGLTCSEACTVDVSDCSGQCQDDTLDPGETCDGAPPMSGSCVGFGYDAGALGCSDFCTPAFDACREIGWKPDSAITATFTSIWVVAADDVYVAAGSAISHWDGVGWSTEAVSLTGIVSALWASGPDDVFAVTGLGEVAHRDGTTWSTDAFPSLELRGLAGRGADDVYAAGSAGRVAHWDGSDWTLIDTATAAEFLGIWVAANGEVFAVGTQGQIVHGDAGQWSSTTTSIGTALHSVWGAAPDDVWVAGTGGALIHFDGAAWTAVPLGTEDDLLAVRGSAADDVYAATATGAIFHKAGSGWIPLDAGDADVAAIGVLGGGRAWACSNTLLEQRGASWALPAVPAMADFTAIDGSGADLVAVGEAGIAMRHDGVSWQTTPTGTAATLRAVSGRYAVGDGGTIVRWDGAAWQPMTSGTTYDLAGVYAAADDDVWAVGYAGTLLHYDGTSWTPRPGVTTMSLAAVAGTWTDDVYVAGFGGVLHWDGVSWSALPPTPGVVWRAVWIGQFSVWLSGNHGEVWRWDGASWTVVPTGVSTDLRSIAGTSDSDVYVAQGTDTVLRWNGSTWSPRLMGGNVRAIWAGGSVRYFGGDDLQLIKNEDLSLPGFSINLVELGEPTTFGGAEIAAVAPDAAVLTNGGEVWRFDGTAWSRVSVSGSFGAVWATGGEAFVVQQNIELEPGAYGGAILHWDGASWDAQGIAIRFAAVGGSGPTDVWAVGGGEIDHYDGVGWGRVENGVGNLRDVWASGPGDAFAVGDGGAIWHWDGTSWTAQASPVTTPLAAVWGAAPDDVFAVGAGGALHYDGTAWTTMDVGTQVALADVEGTSGSDVFAVGDAGHVFHHDGTRWAPVRSPATARLDAVSIRGGVVWIAGQDTPVVRLWRAAPW
jgi:hypothetical protein